MSAELAMIVGFVLGSAVTAGGIVLGWRQAAPEKEPEPEPAFGWSPPEP